MTGRTPDDRPGGDFCEIEGEAPASGHVYHPLRSADLVWLAKEVWSIMDDGQRGEFVQHLFATHPVHVVLPAEPDQQIPPGGAPVVWNDASPSAGYR